MIDTELQAAIRKALGVEAVLSKDLAWDRKSPCGDCPFLKSSPFHEGVANALQSTWESIADGRFAHTCHKTDPRPSCDGPRDWSGPVQHCAGALIMLLKTGDGKDLQLPLLQAVDAGKLDLHGMMLRAKADKRVFTLPQFLRFYLRRIRRLGRR